MCEFIVLEISSNIGALTRVISFPHSVLPLHCKEWSGLCGDLRVGYASVWIVLALKKDLPSVKHGSDV